MRAGRAPALAYPVTTWSSAICRKPDAVPGALLVMVRRTVRVRTGSKVNVVASLEAVAETGLAAEAVAVALAGLDYLVPA